MASKVILIRPNGTTKGFSNIQSAINGATSGDTITVYNGTYTEQITVKNGVNMFCLPGVIITSNNSVGTIIDNGVEARIILAGEPTITNTGIGSRINLTNVNSDINESTEFSNLVISGSLTVTGSEYVNGNMIVTGSTTLLNSLIIKESDYSINYKKSYYTTTTNLVPTLQIIDFTDNYLYNYKLSFTVFSTTDNSSAAFEMTGIYNKSGSNSLLIEDPNIVAIAQSDNFTGSLSASVSSSGEFLITAIGKNSSIMRWGIFNDSTGVKIN